MLVPSGCVRVARREVGSSLGPFGPATTTGHSIAGQGRHAPLQLTRTPRITQTEVVARNRDEPTSGTTCVGALDGRCRPARPPRHQCGWTASDAATVEGGRSRFVNCAAQLVVAAIQVATVRGGRITPGGAGREWTKVEAAGDRRGSGRVRTGGAQFRRPTRPGSPARSWLTCRRRECEHRAVEAGRG